MRLSSQITLGKTRNFPPMYLLHVSRLVSNAIGLPHLLLFGPASRPLVCRSCFSNWELACRFLQISARPAHPCSWSRSSIHQCLNRDSHSTKYLLVRFRFWDDVVVPDTQRKKPSEFLRSAVQNQEAMLASFHQKN